MVTKCPTTAELTKAAREKEEAIKLQDALKRGETPLGVEDLARAEAARSALLQRNMNGNPSTIVGVTPVETAALVQAVEASGQTGKRQGQSVIDEAMNSAAFNRETDPQYDAIEKMHGDSPQRIRKFLGSIVNDVGNLTHKVKVMDHIAAYNLQMMKSALASGQDDEIALVYAATAAQMVSSINQVKDVIADAEWFYRVQKIPPSLNIIKKKNIILKQTFGQNTRENLSKLANETIRASDKVFDKVDEAVHSDLSQQYLADLERGGALSESARENIIGLLKNEKKRRGLLKKLKENPEGLEHWMAVERYRQHSVGKRAYNAASNLSIDALYGLYATTATGAGALFGLANNTVADALHGGKLFLMKGGKINAWDSRRISAPFSAWKELPKGTKDAFSYAFLGDRALTDVDEDTQTGAHVGTSFGEQFPDGQEWMQELKNVPASVFFNKFFIPIFNVASRAAKLSGRGGTVFFDKWANPILTKGLTRDFVIKEATRRWTAETGKHENEATPADVDQQIDAVLQDQQFMRPMMEKVDLYANRFKFLAEIDKQRNPLMHTFKEWANSLGYIAMTAKAFGFTTFFTAPYSALQQMAQAAEVVAKPLEFFGINKNKTQFSGLSHIRKFDRKGEEASQAQKDLGDQDERQRYMMYAIAAVAGTSYLSEALFDGSIKTIPLDQHPADYKSQRIKGGEVVWAADEGKQYNISNWGGRAQVFLKLMDTANALLRHPQIDLSNPKDWEENGSYFEHLMRISSNLATDIPMMGFIYDRISEVEHGRYNPNALERSVAQRTDISILHQPLAGFDVNTPSLQVKYEELARDGLNLMRLLRAEWAKKRRDTENGDLVEGVNFAGDVIKHDPSRIFHYKTLTANDNKLPISSIAQHQRSAFWKRLWSISNQTGDFDALRAIGPEPFGEPYVELVELIQRDNPGYVWRNIYSNLNFPKGFNEEIKFLVGDIGKETIDVRLTTAQRNQMNRKAGQETPIHVGEMIAIASLYDDSESSGFSRSLFINSLNTLSGEVTMKEVLNALASDENKLWLIEDGEPQVRRLKADAMGTFLSSVAGKYHQRAMMLEILKTDGILDEPFDRWLTKNQHRESTFNPAIRAFLAGKLAG